MEEYTNKLAEAGLQLAESYKGAKVHHNILCLLCSETFVATPLSKLQNFKKTRCKGCPSCTNKARYDNSRLHNIQSLQDKGFIIHTKWTGQRVADRNNAPIDLTVTQTKCGHTFTSTAVNLLSRGVTCSVCAKLYKTGVINASSERRSNAWKRTAPEWKVYRSNVTKHTRVTYKANKHIVNPHNYPTGRAGTPGAYHLDHIVPVRWCFERNVPPEIVANVTNLQMLPWLDNVASRDHIKGELPAIFLPYANK